MARHMTVSMSGLKKGYEGTYSTGILFLQLWQHGRSWFPRPILLPLLNESIESSIQAAWLLPESAVCLLAWGAMLSTTCVYYVHTEGAHQATLAYLASVVLIEGMCFFSAA